MARFLSDEWVDALDRALAAADPPALDAPLTIQHVVTDVPERGEVVYHLRLDAKRCRAGRGPADDVTVSFTQTYDTAAGIAAGTASAQAAFMAGELRLGGRVDQLMAHHTTIAELDDVLASVRADTEY